MLSTILKTTLCSLFFVTFIGANETPKVKQLFSVQTVKVKKEQKFIYKKNYGFVTIDETKSFDVSPRYFGYVEKLYVDEHYKKVKKGEPLVKVYSQKVYQLKDKFVESFRYKQDDVIADARERLELLEVGKNKLDQIAKTREYSNYTTIYSPLTGYIFEKSITHGSAFTDTQAIFKIVNLDEVWIEVKIPQEQIEALSEVESFEISLKADSKIYHTNRAKLYPNFSTDEATATLRLIVKNEEHKLFPGMYATIKSKQKSEEYLTLPRTSVIHKNGVYYAFLKTEFEGAYEPVKVHVKPLNKTTYIIKSGLSHNEEVVNNALFMMDSDAQINSLY